jgi:hypothetical protein
MDVYDFQVSNKTHRSINIYPISTRTNNKHQSRKQSKSKLNAISSIDRSLQSEPANIQSISFDHPTPIPKHQHTHPTPLTPPSHYTASHKKYRTSSDAGNRCGRNAVLGFARMLEVAAYIDRRDCRICSLRSLCSLGERRHPC